MLPKILICLACLLPIQQADQPIQTKNKQQSKEEAKFTQSGHTVDSLKAVKEKIQKKQAVLIDVRELNEWQAGHLKDANLVPLSLLRAGKLTKDMEKSLPKDKPIYCHCKSGGRVLLVSKILRAKGYDVRPLKAGYSSLLKEGFKKAEDLPPAKPTKR